MLRNTVAFLLLSVIVQAADGSAASIRMDFREPFTEKSSGRGSFDKSYACGRC